MNHFTKQRLRRLLVIASLALAASLLAQATPAQAKPAEGRRPLIGKVLQANGKPLADATVTLVEDDPDMVGVDEVDLLTVTTNKRGRFVASALRGVRYTAFAVGPELEAKPSEGALLARPVPDLACGRFAELHATQTGSSRRLQLEDLSDWGKPADLRVRLTWDRCPGHFVELAIDDKGGVAVPASVDIAKIRLYGARGEQLGPLWKPKPNSDQLLVPPCVRVSVRVVDDQSKPLAGVAVAAERAEHSGGFFTIHTQQAIRYDTATTDAQGRASLRCQLARDPFQHAPGSLAIIATKRGFEEGASGWLYREPFANWKAATHAKPEVRITLKPAKGAASQLAASTGGSAFASAHAKLLAMTNVLSEQHGFTQQYYLQRSYSLRFGPAGEPPTVRVPTAATKLILKVPSVAGRRVMLLPTIAPVLPTCDLSQCEPLVLNLLDASGGPANDASVLLVPRDSTTLDSWHATPIVPDQAGRVELLLQRGDWSLIAMNANSWISHELDEWSGDRPLQLQLTAKPSRRVRVVDSDGQPVANAQFEPGSFRHGFVLALGVDKMLFNLGRNTFGHHVRRAKTDKLGEATLHFLPWPKTAPKAFAWLGDHRTRSDDVAVFVADGDSDSDDILEFRIR